MRKLLLLTAALAFARALKDMRDVDLVHVHMLYRFPQAAAAALRRKAEEAGIALQIAVITGDDLTPRADEIRAAGVTEMFSGGVMPERLTTMNAYLGAQPIALALDRGADVVITGRCVDSAVVLGPMVHAFGWSYDDYAKLAFGTLAGHLLECSGQLTGGCFADPGKKEVEDLAGLGYPLADVWSDGRVEIAKTPGSGGRLDIATCTEQLLYEMHDPSAYITPDCVVDITDVRLEQVARDRVAVRGPKGRPRTPTYKVTVGYFDGYIGEGQVSFGGPNAVARAKLGAEVVQARLKERGFAYPELQVDLIGYSSVHGELPSRPEPYEVRLRIAARTGDRRAAEAVGFETRALHMHGPAGAGGGSDPMVREILAVQSVLLPRELVSPEIGLEGEA